MTRDNKLTFSTALDNKQIIKDIGQTLEAFEKLGNEGKVAFDKLDSAADVAGESAAKLEKAWQIDTPETEKLIRDLDNVNAQIVVQQKLLEQLKDKYELAMSGCMKDSPRTLNLQKNILTTEQSINRLTDKSDKLAAELSKIDGQADKAADSVEHLGKETGKTTEEIDNVGDSARSTENKIGSLSIAFGHLVAEGIARVIDGLIEAQKQTREYREDLSKLEVNAQIAGIGIDVATESLRDLNAITGESDSNIEALSNLMSAGFKDNNMKEAVDALSGAVIKFPDTLKIESLADSLQETIATGEATGQFAEMLERLGIDLDKFNEKMEKAKERGEEQQYVLDVLSKSGLADVNEAYRQNNQALIENANAQFDWNQTLTELAEFVEPLITSAIQSINTFVMENKDVLQQWGEVITYVGYVVLAALEILAGLPPSVVMIIGMVLLAVTAFTKVSAAIKESTGVIGTVSNAFKAANPTFGQTAIMVMSVVAAVALLVFLLVALKEGADKAAQAMDEFGNAANEVKNIQVPNAAKNTRGYATGTLSATPGMAVVGENGPEIINLAGGERIYNATQTRAMMGNQVTQSPINYYINEISIPAKDVKSFMDVIKIMEKVPQMRRARGGR